MYRYYPSIWRTFVNQQRRFSIPGFREASVVDTGQIPKSNAEIKINIFQLRAQALDTRMYS